MHVKNKMYEYIGDELVNKVKHLSQALDKARDIIISLEQENNRLAEAFSELCHEESWNSYASENNVSETVGL
jgi:hypothetical protein